MKAVITVIGKDSVGLISNMSAVCAECHVNIVDITQKVIEDLFVMMMITEIDGMNVKFTEFVDRMNKKGKEMGLEVHTMHEDIFNAMHKI